MPVCSMMRRYGYVKFAPLFVSKLINDFFNFEFFHVSPEESSFVFAQRALDDVYSGEVSSSDNWCVFLVAKYVVPEIMPDSYRSDYGIQPVIGPDLPWGDDWWDEETPWFLIAVGATDLNGFYTFNVPFFDEEYGYMFPGIISTMVIASKTDSTGVDVSIWLASLGDVFSDADLAACSFIEASNVETFLLDVIDEF